MSDLTGAVLGEKFSVTCDCTGAGWGEAKFDVVLHGRSLPHTVRETSKGIYTITFTPQERGKHRIYVYYNGIESRGVPFVCISFLCITFLCFAFHSAFQARRLA